MVLTHFFDKYKNPNRSSMDFKAYSNPNVSGDPLDQSLEIDESSMEALSREYQVFLVILYSLTALLSLLGNLTVIVVLIVGKRSSRELRVFLVNLAISDVTMSVFSIPFTYLDFMLGRWIFEPAFCPVVLFMQHCSVLVSVYTLTVVGIDRYYAILYPLTSRWTKSRGPLIVILVWVVSIGMSSVQFVHGMAVKIAINGKFYYNCEEVWDDTEGKVYTVAVFVISFMLPMLVLVFTYSSIGWKLWNHTSPGNQDNIRDHQQLMAKLKAAKMLATVVLLFAVCWLPIQIFNLLIYFNPEFTIAMSDQEYYTFIVVFFVCHWLSMANSFVNPVIYCFMSDTFKTDLKQLFCVLTKHSGKNHKLVSNRSSYGSSFRTTTLSSTHSCSVMRAHGLSSLKSNHTPNNHCIPLTSKLVVYDEKASTDV